mmetsp:Transcript_6243/g.12980  ORF Transcript_6243/g.12980 Transcript_6243/m.12980 type:complete len:202 (-) Transcript_6243:194-799(-)
MDHMQHAACATIQESRPSRTSSSSTSTLTGTTARGFNRCNYAPAPNQSLCTVSCFSFATESASTFASSFASVFASSRLFCGASASLLLPTFRRCDDIRRDGERRRDDERRRDSERLGSSFGLSTSSTSFCNFSASSSLPPIRSTLAKFFSEVNVSGCSGPSTSRCSTSVWRYIASACFSLCAVPRCAIDAAMLLMTTNVCS